MKVGRTRQRGCCHNSCMKRERQRWRKSTRIRKKFLLEAINNDLGLPQGEMWPFTLSDDDVDDKKAYGNLTEVKDDLVFFNEVVDKKKLVEATNAQMESGSF